MTFATITLDRLERDKELIDAVIDRIEDSRVSYILRSNNAYQRTIKFLEGTDEDTQKAVLRHRFYYEIKVEQVIKNDRF